MLILTLDNIFSKYNLLLKSVHINIHSNIYTLFQRRLYLQNMLSNVSLLLLNFVSENKTSKLIPKYVYVNVLFNTYLTFNYYLDMYRREQNFTHPISKALQ